jgi:hypothetical protein
VISDWDIKTHFVEEAQESRGDNFTCLMEINSKWEYKQAHIWVYLYNFYNNIPKKDMKKKAENTVVYELGHAIVNEMREKGIKHEERVVTHLTNMILWMEKEHKKEIGRVKSREKTNTAKRQPRGKKTTHGKRGRI